MISLHMESGESENNLSILAVYDQPPRQTTPEPEVPTIETIPETLPQYISATKTTYFTCSAPQKETKCSGTTPTKSSFNEICRKIKKDNEDFPGLVIAVVGDSVSLVPRPWNTTKFTSNLKTIVNGANNCWIICHGKKDSVSAYIKKAFLSEKVVKGLNEEEDTYHVITHSEEHEHAVDKCSVRSIPKIDSEFLRLMSERTTPLLKKKLLNSKEGGLSMRVPVVMIVVEGDVDTIKQVAAAVKVKIPVVLIKGSGKAADLIANYMDESERSGKEKLLKKRAPRLFGVHFYGSDIDELQVNMEEIDKCSHLISVFDVNDQNANMEEEVVEAIINSWSFKDFSGDQTDTSQEENSKGMTRKKSITMHVVKKAEGKRLMDEYQFRLDPGSLSLYFYIAYQYIQEFQHAKGDKEKDLELLLVEAIVAGRVDYVSAMLQNGVEFNPDHLEILYDESVVCKVCEGIDCRNTHSIHHKKDKSTSVKIWCTCSSNCEKDGPYACNSKTCKRLHFVCDCPCIRHNKSEILGPDKKIYSDFCPQILKQGRHLCQLLLEHAKVYDVQAYLCCDNCSVAPDQQLQVNDIYQDLLAWALFLNKKELAGLFWSKCKGNQLLSAVMASSLLKNMAHSVESAKDRKLRHDLLSHSKLFEARVIKMQNTLYEEKEFEAMKLMGRKGMFWGINISPMACAYENNMTDVIGHPCVQRQLNRIWYNNDPDSSKTAAAAKLTDYCLNFCCCGTCKSRKEAFLSPITVFIMHYLSVLCMIAIFSAFILTNLKTVNSISDIGKYEWILYVWVIADVMEEYIVPSIVRNRYRIRRKHGRYFRFKRAVFNFWNVLTLLSYIFFAAAVFMRVINAADYHRATLRMYSLALFTMYMRFLQCMIIHSYFGPKIIMIGEMLLELIKFVWILIVFMMCSGVLYHANMYPSHFDMWSTKGVEYWRFWKIISLPYWQIYGELALDDLKGENNANGTCTSIQSEWEANPDIERCVEYDWALLIIAASYLLITNLLLVNLIIALFSYKFDEVQKDSDRLWKFWRYSIITKFSKRQPVPFNIIFLPWKIIARCTKDQKEAAILVEEQELHAIRCLYFQSEKK